MSADTHRSLRMLAPVSVALFAVIFLVVVVVSLGGDSGSVDAPKGTGRTGQGRPAGRSGSAGRERGPRYHTVKRGDSLSTIAEETGVTVGKLRALNPSLDPQQLVAGQRVKLRE